MAKSADFSVATDKQRRHYSISDGRGATKVAGRSEQEGRHRPALVVFRRTLGLTQGPSVSPDATHKYVDRQVATQAPCLGE